VRRAPRALGVLSLLLMMIVGALWLLAVLAAQVTCSLVPFIPPQCQKSDLDVWGMPFLTAPIGFPCLLVSIVVFVIASARKRRSQS
jgi:hypothetical protein